MSKSNALMRPPMRVNNDGGHLGGNSTVDNVVKLPPISVDNVRGHFGGSSMTDDAVKLPSMFVGRSNGDYLSRHSVTNNVVTSTNAYKAWCQW